MNRIYHASILAILSLTIASQALAQDSTSENLTESKITSVSQLSDVKPTDWAFQALQSLIERYGVVAGYPDKTFRGDRSMTRYEFAVGLSATLDRIDEMLKAGLADKVGKEDLLVLSQLQEGFAAELNTLRGRVDTLNAKTVQLEAQQFSTTTKLRGESIFAIHAGLGKGNDANAIFMNRSRLNLETSFTGKDLLRTQLQAGSGAAGDAAASAQSENTAFKGRLARLGEAQIQQRFEGIFFPIADLGVTLQDLGIGLAGLPTVEEVQNKYAGVIATLDLEAGVSSEDILKNREALLQRIKTGRNINRFLQRNSALDYSGTASGLTLNRLSYTFPVSKDLQVAVFPQGVLSDYVDGNRYANNSAANFSTSGLVNNQLLLANDTPGAGAAISWKPGRGAVSLRAAYRAEQTALAPSESAFTTEKQGGLFNSANLGVVELEINPTKTSAVRFQYSRGVQGNRVYDVLGANLEVPLGKNVGLFGRFGYALNFPGDMQAIGWSAGLAFPDLFKKGNMAGISVGQPLVLQNDSTGIFNAIQTNYEVFYRVRLNDHISISPVIQVITNPGNLKSDTIFTATLRTVFSF
jgi:Carbohydrate-selective porin, OprB family/S-layer homology domain